MTTTPPQPAGRQRGNGLTADSYVLLAQCDPRLTGAVLAALAAAGVAAYTAPATGQRGGYLDVRLPARPVDQIFADATRAALATEIVQAELAAAEEPAPLDEAAAFAELVATFYADSAEPGPIPPIPPIPPAPPPPAPLPGGGSDLFDLDTVEHFEPPEPEPIPRPVAATRWALVALLAGLALLVAPAVGGDTNATGVQALGVAAIVGAVASLVWRMHDRDDDDDDPDDGAVV